MKANVGENLLSVGWLILIKKGVKTYFSYKKQQKTPFSLFDAVVSFCCYLFLRKKP
jgi:hypothetical protein